VQSIDRDAADYPSRVAGYLGDDAPRVLTLVGDHRILQGVQLALICSVSCPGSVVIKTFDTIRKVRDAGLVVAGGFHSPMERECLHFLLRGRQPVVLCPACGMDSFELGLEEWRAVDDGRLSVLSMFDQRFTKATPELASQRNDFVAALSGVVFVPHAVPGGTAEAAARRALARGQVVVTFDDAENRHLIDRGAIDVFQSGIHEIRSVLTLVDQRIPHR
jgi:predicted Rossmann fold nucleotide-binding protein DprA/Smf involved in DNA uptake